MLQMSYFAISCCMMLIASAIALPAEEPKDDANANAGPLHRRFARNFAYSHALAAAYSAPAPCCQPAPAPQPQYVFHVVQAPAPQPQYQPPAPAPAPQYQPPAPAPAPSLQYSASGSSHSQSSQSSSQQNQYSIQGTLGGCHGFRLPGLSCVEGQTDVEPTKN